MVNTDHLFFGLDFFADSSEPINFVETRFMDLSAFSAHEVVVEDIVFKTVEHGYHALRIKPGSEREAVMSQASPMNAWREGQKYKNNLDLLIEGYGKYIIMELLCRAKLEQHDDVKEVLLATGNRELLKVYDTDYWWGTGSDGTGKNKMGKLWMKLRDELKNKV